MPPSPIIDVDRLLVGSYGQAWTADALRQALKRLGRHTHTEGVRVSPHTFRHQFAHHVAYSGGSLIALRDILGHRSLAIVERYAVPDDAARLDLLQQRTPMQRLRGDQRGRRIRFSGDESS